MGIVISVGNKDPREAIMFDITGAVVAGLVGGAAMSVLLYAGIAMAPGQMKMNLFAMLGTMMGGKPGPMTYVMGAMIHAGMSIAFGVVHGALFAAFDLEGDLVAWGLAFGAVHWFVVGMMFGGMKMMHPLIRSGEMADPGMFALKYPMMTAAGFLMLHLAFGVLFGLVYEAFL